MMEDSNVYGVTQDLSGSTPLGEDGPAPQPERVGRYRIEKLLGQGGFGHVYLAHDEQLKRPVALKLPHARLISRPGDAEIYLAEARAVANLDHPVIVPVYDVGNSAEWPCYVVSKYINGTDLATRVNQQWPHYRDAAELVATIAEALHYAHKQGVVHRDVKPGNILISCEGQPYLVDFGLALSEENVGKGPKYAGTPAYMSPEQARGEGHRVDGRSDVFSLGVVFYELLVGRRPFRGQTRSELMEQVIEHDPKPLRQYDETLPRELERMCRKAMAKRASERYSSAYDFAEDLRHFLAEHIVGDSGMTIAYSPVPSDTQTVAPTSGSTTSPASSSETKLGASSDGGVIRVVPKGLRSFDEHDADFFLNLLAGPRDRDGLPEIIRFWKTRIEERDADKTFAVGLIYGPSGCGKSSLVKAGLLPHLSSDVIAVYVEATPDETASRLTYGLRKHCADLPRDLTLKETLMALRQGQFLDCHQKVLIVLDQFEQWLHTHRDDADAELVAALRQCDGSHVQVVLMVRDDFWLAISRFMRELEIRLLEGRNSALVDLFDTDHARKVLTAFGQALGQLPEKSSAVSQEQKEFLKQSIAGLADEGRIICVRLALFADMLKNKPWTPATLRSMGGTTGVGVTFLEETFSASTAPPEHRYHQNAARNILRSLLPELGSDIKGHMRSTSELSEASGYARRPQDFEEIISILDGELRLITPTDVVAGDASDESQPSDANAGQKYYQLTHDYLVPSLRDWLHRNQRATRKGRAELRLAERAALWNTKPENRHLPSLWEYLSIASLTRPQTWSGGQRTMMSRAGWIHGTRAALTLGVLALLVFAGVRVRGRIVAEQRRVREEAIYKERIARVEELVGSLKNANIAKVDEIVSQLEQFTEFRDPLLRTALAAAPDGSSQKRNLSLGLLATDPEQVDYLYHELLTAETHAFPVIRDFLADHRQELIPNLWDVTKRARSERDGERLRAAAALATYDPESAQWSEVCGQVAADLAAVPISFVSEWKNAFRPVAWSLREPLTAIYSDEEEDEVARSLATSLLADYADNNPQELAHLLILANEKQFAELFPVLARHKSAAILELRAILEQRIAPDWRDTDLDPGWPPLPQAAAAAIEAAAGMLSEQFAVCQTMPFRLCIELMEVMRASGYRPVSFRPYNIGERVQVASVWTRDDLPWRLEYDLESTQIIDLDQELRQQNLVPIDVSGYVTIAPDGIRVDRYSAIWVEGTGDDHEFQLYAGIPSQSERTDHVDPLVAAGFHRLTWQLFTGEDGTERRSSVWSKQEDQEDAVSQVFEGVASQLSGDIFPGLLLTDIDVACNTDTQDNQQLIVEDRYAAVWNVSTEYESRELHGLSPAKHREQWSEMVRDGFRPSAIDVSPTMTRNSLIAASVWHRPTIPQSDKQKLAMQQASAGIGLIRLDHADDAVWSLLKHSPDPQVRSYLINQVGPMEVAPQAIVERLAVEQDVSARRALILMLGEFDWQHWPATDRSRLTEQLLETYANATDAGLHSAAEWALRQWGHDDKLDETNARLASAALDFDRLWYVNQQGQTLIVIPGPVEFLMGSPVDEATREGGPHDLTENLHHKQISRSFAIMAHEVTVDQFRRFQADFAYSKRFSREGSAPINQVNWYAAAAYCNWLSKQDGLPEDEWCYLLNANGEYAEGMKPAPNYLSRMGYRLPTESEWEFACRAGTTTSRYFGEDPSLLDRYAWYTTNSENRWLLPVGSLKPNDFGLFDTQGNVYEWCHDTDKPYLISDSGGLTEDAPDSSELQESRLRILRGGSFNSLPQYVRSAFRLKFSPGYVFNAIGLRVARTLPERN